MAKTRDSIKLYASCSSTSTHVSVFDFQVQKIAYKIVGFLFQVKSPLGALKLPFWPGAKEES